MVDDKIVRKGAVPFPDGDRDGDRLLWSLFGEYVATHTPATQWEVGLKATV